MHPVLNRGLAAGLPVDRRHPRPSTPCGLHSIHQHTSDLQLGINRGYSSTLSICYIRNITLHPRSDITRSQQAHCRDIVKYLRNAICNIFRLRNICAIENLDIKANLILFAKTKKSPTYMKNCKHDYHSVKDLSRPQKRLSRICQGKNLLR